MKIQLSRIILFARDVNKLKSFYQDYFNLNLIEEIKDEWVVLNAGPVEIAFHKVGADFDKNKDLPFKAHSNTKLVFDVKEDLASFRDDLLGKGVFLKELKSFDGSHCLFCDGEDLEGNVFQLRQN